jgi:hypothetical protein
VEKEFFFLLLLLNVILFFWKKNELFKNKQKLKFLCNRFFVIEINHRHILNNKKKKFPFSSSHHNFIFNNRLFYNENKFSFSCIISTKIIRLALHKPKVENLLKLNYGSCKLGFILLEANLKYSLGSFSNADIFVF